MKRFLSIILLVAATISMYAQSVKIDGVKYALKKGVVECSLVDKYRFECTVQSEVVIKNRRWPVSVVAAQGFKNADRLTKVTLPNTIRLIRWNAFYGCANLTEIVLPDNADLERNYYGNNSNLPFAQCRKLSSIKGQTVECPDYILNTSWTDSRDACVPFAKKIPQLRANLKRIVKSQDGNSFSVYAESRILQQIEVWQQKKEYETTRQWQDRVTEANRAKKVEQLLEEVKREYISKNTTTLDENGQLRQVNLSCSVGYYDADYGIFPITDNKFGTFYAQVPISDALAFKDNFGRVRITPTYGIRNDRVSIVAATFAFNNKVYQSAENFGSGADEDITINLPPLQLDLGGDDLLASSTPRVAVDRTIDTQIPETSARNSKTFAIIIGNENYTEVAKVPFANNDANVFAAYCKKTLGLPEKNIKTYNDATFGTILEAMTYITNVSRAYKGDLSVIFYYAGHGVPNESTGDAYLLPVDASGRQTEACYPLERLYKELGELKARSVMAFIDACFSGAERGDGMLASARGVAIKAKGATARGNMVVFSAATGDQTAYPYDEKGHGLFTYFLLKKLQETKGEATLGEIANYVSEQVERQSVVVNSKTQTPTVTSSAALSDKWRKLKLK